MRERYEETMQLTDGTIIYFDYLERDSLNFHGVYAFTNEERKGVPDGGYLLWSDAGKVEHLQVGESYRRQGIGTYLYKLACEKAGKQLEPSKKVEIDGELFIEGLKQKRIYQ